MSVVKNLIKEGLQQLQLFSLWFCYCSGGRGAGAWQLVNCTDFPLRAQGECSVMESKFDLWPGILSPQVNALFKMRVMLFGKCCSCEYECTPFKFHLSQTYQGVKLMTVKELHTFSFGAKREERGSGSRQYALQCPGIHILQASLQYGRKQFTFPHVAGQLLCSWESARVTSAICQCPVRNIMLGAHTNLTQNVEWSLITTNLGWSGIHDLLGKDPSSSLTGFTRKAFSAGLSGFLDLYPFKIRTGLWWGNLLLFCVI